MSTSTTTFGYDTAQDRVWMREHEQDFTVWFTRRMVRGMLGPMLKAFEDSTPGQQAGARSSARAAIEHQLSLHEVQPGQAPAQIRSGQETPGTNSDPQEGLCQSVTIHAGPDQVVLEFESGAGRFVAQTGRPGMHLWYRGLVMVLRQADWNLPEPLPQWLTQGLLPPSLMAMMLGPPQPDLDEPDSGG